MEIFYFMIVAYGMANILVYGKIFDKPRNWVTSNSEFLKKLLSCIFCTGWWVGVYLSLLLFSPALALKLDNPILNWGLYGIYPLALFFDGCFTSGICWLIHNVQEWFEFNARKPKKNY